MKPTKKQVSKICYLWRNIDLENYRKLWEVIPKNNKKYPDKRANYRQAILCDWLMDRATSRQCSYIIQLLITADRRPTTKLAALLRKINKQVITKI